MDDWEMADEAEPTPPPAAVELSTASAVTKSSDTVKKEGSVSLFPQKYRRLTERRERKLIRRIEFRRK